MQPWQEAGESRKASAKLPFQRMAQAANLLSYAVPTGIAVQGLGKMNPTLNKFFKLASQYGFSQADALNNLREKKDESEQQQSRSLFRRLVGDIDFSKLDERSTKELTFLEKIANQFEEKGKNERDPEVKKLKKKIDKALKGLTGMVESEAMQMAPEQQLQPIQPQPMQQQPMQPQAQQPGQGEQALMAILQKIQAQRGQ